MWSDERMIAQELDDAFTRTVTGRLEGGDCVVRTDPGIKAVDSKSR